MLGRAGLGALSRLHAFPKPDEGVVQPTVSGGIGEAGQLGTSVPVGFLSKRRRPFASEESEAGGAPAAAPFLEVEAGS